MRKYANIIVGILAVGAGYFIAAFLVAKFINLVNYFM
jgi:hypothetical protein